MVCSYTPETRCWGRLPHRDVRNLLCILGLAQTVPSWAWHRQCLALPHTCSKKNPVVGSRTFAVASELPSIVLDGFYCLFLYLLLSHNSIPSLFPWSQVDQVGLTPALQQGLAHSLCLASQSTLSP